MSESTMVRVFLPCTGRTTAHHKAWSRMRGIDTVNGYGNLLFMATQTIIIGSRVFRISDGIGTVIGFDGESGYAVHWDHNQRYASRTGYTETDLYVLSSGNPVVKPKTSSKMAHRRRRSLHTAR